MTNVIDFATRRPVGQPTPISQYFTTTERPGLRGRHALDLVEIVATVRKDVGDSLFSAALELRERSAEARRLRVIPTAAARSLAPSQAGATIPEVFYAADWECDSGAWVLDLMLTRQYAAEMCARLQAAGVGERYYADLAS